MTEECIIPTFFTTNAGTIIEIAPQGYQGEEKHQANVFID